MMSIDISPFDSDLQELLRKSQDHPDDMTVLSQVCYAFNIRSYHNLCIGFARKGMAQHLNHVNLYYELIIASSLDTAHVLEEIYDELVSILETDPNNVGMQRNLGLVNYFLERDEDAANVLHQILDNTHHLKIGRRTYEVLAQVEYSRHNIEQCLEYCELAIGKPGSCARMIRLKGLCYQELGELEKAKHCFHFALELEPYFVWACHSLAVLYLEEQNYVKAFQYFGKASFINPRDPGNQFLLAEAFMDIEAYDLAAAELNKLLLLNPEERIKAEIYNALGFLFISKQDPKQAEIHLKKAIELEPELAVAYYNLGQLANQQKSFTLAEQHFKSALRIDAQLIDSWVELGFLHFQNEHYEDAKRCFFSALDIDPYEAQIFLGLSKLAQVDREAATQLKHALQAYKLDPDHPEICNNLGIAYECAHCHEDAESAYEQALELDPNHSPAANNLGFLYEKMMKLRPEEALLYKERAIDAWKNRLRICLERKKSTKGAISHLLELGISQDEIDLVTQNLHEN